MMNDFSTNNTKLMTFIQEFNQTQIKFTHQYFNKVENQIKLIISDK